MQTLLYQQDDKMQMKSAQLSDGSHEREEYNRRDWAKNPLVALSFCVNKAAVA